MRLLDPGRFHRCVRFDELGEHGGTQLATLRFYGFPTHVSPMRSMYCFISDHGISSASPDLISWSRLRISSSQDASISGSGGTLAQINDARSTRSASGISRAAW